MLPTSISTGNNASSIRQQRITLCYFRVCSIENASAVHTNEPIDARAFSGIDHVTKRSEMPDIRYYENASLSWTLSKLWRRLETHETLLKRREHRAIQQNQRQYTKAGWGDGAAIVEAWKRGKNSQNDGEKSIMETPKSTRYEQAEPDRTAEPSPAHAHARALSPALSQKNTQKITKTIRNIKNNGLSVDVEQTYEMKRRPSKSSRRLDALTVPIGGASTGISPAVSPMASPRNELQEGQEAQQKNDRFDGVNILKEPHWPYGYAPFLRITRDNHTFELRLAQFTDENKDPMLIELKQYGFAAENMHIMTTLHIGGFIVYTRLRPKNTNPWNMLL